MTDRPLLLFAALGGILSLALGPLSAAQPERLPAHVVVRLPADAKLTIDGQATISTSATRRFVTPALEGGKDFQYTFKAKLVRGRETVTMTEVVPVRAGRETVVSLALPSDSDSGAAGGYGSFEYPSSFVVPPPSPHVAPASEQDPMRDAGPPSSNDPLAQGVGQG